MSVSKITSKGQITLPKAIREYLELEAGDKVEFRIDAEGRVIMTPKTIDIKDVFGMVDSDVSVSIDEMNQAIAKKLKRKNKRDSD